METEFNKKTKSVFAVYGILAFVYVLAFCVLPFHKTAASWIEFIFTMIAFMGSLFVFFYAFSAKRTIQSKIYGYPIFRVSAVYAVVQLCIGIIICIVDAIVTIPYWVALLVSVLLFGMASIGVIITENTRDMVESVDESVKVDIEAITSFQTNISRIADMCEEPGLKAELEKLREQLRYADPVSSERTREIEADIETALTGLKELVNDGNTDDAKSLIKKITVALNERNRICKVSKV